MLKVRIEDEHGTVLYEAEFCRTQPMDAQKVIDEWDSENDYEEVSWREFCNNCYRYAVVFFDPNEDDEDCSETIFSSTGFNRKQHE